MWKWVKTEAAYYVLALKECQSWKGYQAMMRMSRLVRILAVILFGGIGIITVINFLQPHLPKLSWLAWVNIGFLLLLLSLILVIHFLGRSYDRAMHDAKKIHDSEMKIQSQYAERNATLSYAIATGRMLYEQLDNGLRVSAQRLANWRSETVSDLAICFGNDIAIRFCGKEKDDPPSTGTEQRAWLNEYVNRLGSLGTNLQVTNNSRKLQT